MSILQKHVPFVKEQIEFQERMATRYAENLFRANLHNATKAKFELLKFELEAVDKALDEHRTQISPAPSGRLRLSLTPQEIEGLSEEVLKELSISEGDKTEFAIMSLIEEAGGITSLDRLIVGLWRKTGESIKRQTLTSKLYRMGLKDLVFNVPGKKGVYSNRRISEEEAVKL